MPSTELVLARYQEDVSWALDLGVPLRVYDKGPGGDLPNAGREAHTYLHHIVQRYDTLAGWTVFCQGDPAPHLSGVDVRDLLAPPERDDDPVVVPHHVTLREWGADGRLRWAGWPAWAGRYGTEIRPARFGLPGWLEAYVVDHGPAPVALTYHPGAIFGVSKGRIRSRPREFYEGLLRQVSDHPHPEEAHYLERSWPLVFGGPLASVVSAPPGAPPMALAAPNARNPVPAFGAAGAPRAHKVFVAVPHYDQLAPQALEGLMLCTDRHNFHLRTGGGSLLAMGFNGLWCAALNTRAEHGWTHFAMHHSDLEAPPGWLDTLLDEMDRTGADLLSVCVPIKDQRGLSSTGWQDPKTGAITRLTMAELMRLPETFSAADLGKERLMVNTGLFVCRFDRPWVEQHAFQILDTITRGADGRFRPRTLPEDWGFSAWLADRGLKAYATRKVPVVHYGKCGYRNDHVWGQWETDHGDQASEAEPKPDRTPAAA